MTMAASLGFPGRNEFICFLQNRDQKRATTVQASVGRARSKQLFEGVFQDAVPEMLMQILTKVGSK